jgi:hypothetical protein
MTPDRQPCVSVYLRARKITDPGWHSDREISIHVHASVVIHHSLEAISYDTVSDKPVNAHYAVVIDAQANLSDTQDCSEELSTSAHVCRCALKVIP